MSGNFITGMNQNNIMPMPAHNPQNAPTNIFGDVTIVSSHHYPMNPYNPNPWDNAPNGMNPMMALLETQKMLTGIIASEMLALKADSTVKLMEKYLTEEGKAKFLNNAKVEQPAKLLAFDKDEAVDVTPIEVNDVKPTITSPSTSNNYIDPKIYLAMLDKNNYNRFFQENENAPVIISIDANNLKDDQEKTVFAEKLTNYFKSFIKSKKLNINDNTEFVLIGVYSGVIRVEGIQKNVEGLTNETIIDRFQNYGFLKGFRNWISDMNENEYVDSEGRGMACEIASYTVDNNGNVVVNPVANVM